MPEAEVWSVAIAPNNIQTMTLDQLDDAFQRGLITDNAMVWTDGMDSWMRLREVLGEEEPAPAQPAPVRAAPVQAPVATSAFPPVAAAPAPAPGSAPNSLAPVAMAPSPSAPIGLSLGDDLDLDGFGVAKKKAKWPFVAAAAVALGGLGFTAANLSGGEVDASKAASAALVAPGDQPIGSPVPADEKPLSAGGYKISAAEEAKFKAEEAKEAEQRDRVAAALAAKPAEEPKPAAHKSAGGHHRAQKQSSSSGLHKGGSKFDPLNGSLP
jgi:hypothetical protein